MRLAESLNICNQIIIKIKDKDLYFNDDEDFNFNKHQLNEYINYDEKNSSYNNMEELIHHFKDRSDGFSLKSNWTYQSIESPKGEFGVSIISDNTQRPYRCKIRSPSYQNLQALPKISKGHFLADLVTLIGTIDIVFGEVDR